VLSTAASFAFPLLVIRMIEIAARSHNYGLIDRLAAMLALFALLHAVFQFVQTYLLTHVGERVVFDLRTSLYGHLQKLPLNFYGIRGTGDLLSRLSNDTAQIRALLTNYLATFLTECLNLVGVIAFIIWLDTRFLFFALTLGTVVVTISFVMGMRIGGEGAHAQTMLADSSAIAAEGLQGIRVVKSFGREAHETRRYGFAMEKVLRASLRLGTRNAQLGGVMTFLTLTLFGGIVWFGGRDAIAGRLALAVVTGFIFLGSAIPSSIGILGTLYGQVRAAIGGVRLVFEILDTKPEIEDSPGARTLPACAGNIIFRNVSFGYEQSLPVLHNISLEIQAGEILALVGPSGAGKSTIFNLIPRFYDPTSGTIEIAGLDLRSVTQESLRSQMGIVPQETLLFRGTIRENILYGRLTATEEEIVTAAQLANAHDFITNFPDGYDTLVGERGQSLSGGQRQRIAIARAILKDSSILMLDEATSALDSESEQLVQEALRRLMRGRTTIIIAHRLSTVKAAHRIALLERGRLIALGRHEELLERNDLYSKLYKMQFRSSSDEQPMAVSNVPQDHADDEIALPQTHASILGMFGGH
jgi:subfamily B ATP-binding cassette protein MsbA